MNREIKFRVWSILESKYLSSYANKGLQFFTNYSRVGDPHYIVGVDWFITAQELENPVNYYVQQFTGLKDKDGREIYEGDIVELQELGFDGTPSEKKYLCEIFVKKPANSCWFFHARPLPVDEGGRQFSLYNNQYQIVGNVFENPELLAQ